jgi:hypothetical protein
LNFQKAFIPLIFPRNQQNVVQGNAMNPDQPTETHSEPAPAEKPAATGQTDNRRRHGRGGRSRFKRDGRGRRGENEGHREQPRGGDGHAQEHRHAHQKPAGSIGRAMEQVEDIQRELQKVLEDIEQVLQTLDQVEREKTASEEEIEMLRESLRMLQRDTGQQRNFRGSHSPKTAPSAPAPAAEPEDSPEED